MQPLRSVGLLAILVVLALGQARPLAAQDSAKLSLSFSRQTFPQAVVQLEAATPYRFYFRAADLDSFRVTTSMNNETVFAFLSRLFQATPYRFLLDNSRVYVAKQSALSAALPPDFFDRQKPFVATTAPLETFNAEQPVATRRLNTAIENRLFEIGTITSSPKQKVTLAGYVRDEKNGETIAGAFVAVDSLSAGVLTDGFGYYSLTLRPGRHVLRIQSSGMKATSRQVLLRNDGKLDIDMATYVPSLKEVVVSAVRTSNVRSAAMGRERLSAQTIKQVPVVFGEADVLRAVLSLPGVTSVGEANTGLNVRGGAANQNLILLNDATIYNPAHLFGFFSAFNPDIVKGVELYKSVVPEKYGGRLSSVLDVTTKQGNTKKLSGSLGIGPLTSKLTLEGPLNKERTTFIASVRSTYSNWLLQLVPDEIYKNSKASFYDGNFHLTHTINARNSLYLNAYLSHDDFRLNGDTVFRYGNKNINLKWKHNFTNQFVGLFTAGLDRYSYAIGSDAIPVNAYRLDFSVQQAHARADFTYTPNTQHVFSFGVTALHYRLQPGSLQPSGKASLVKPDDLQQEQALESALYIGDEYNPTSRLSLRGGLRFSLFNALGPREQYVYRNGVPRDKNTMEDTLFLAKGKFIKTYSMPEVRLSLRYSLSDDASLKLGFNTTAQYIHTLSNTNTVLPTDVFKLSDAYIRPQQGVQVSAGYYRNFQANAVETSLEVYYKKTAHYLDFKSGANPVLNHHIETDVIDTRGKAYGAELIVRKSSGKLTGWTSYSYSRVFWQSADPLAGEQVNGGAYYPANFDKPHNANLNANYKFSHRFSLSWATAYSTGRPITLPLAVFNLAGSQRVFYSERNGFRTPDYFRADVSFMLEGNHKTTKATHNSWTVGVYNLTGRKNVYSIYFTQNNGVVKGYSLSIFGAPIPFVTYTLRF